MLHLGCYRIFITSPMVRKMLKAFIKVTADKTYFLIDISQHWLNLPYSITIHLSTTIQVSQLLPHLIYFTIHCISCSITYIISQYIYHSNNFTVERFLLSTSFHMFKTTFVGRNVLFTVYYSNYRFTTSECHNK